MSTSKPSFLRIGAVALAVAALPTLALAADKDIPRTSDGRPDLSGTYDVATLTPLQRPTQFGDNLYLTREQALEIEKKEQELLARGLEQSDPNRTAPPEGGAAPVGFEDGERETLGAGNVGGYNSFWIDRGSEVFSIDGKMRTSIITEPKNGRQPPLAPEAQKRLGAMRALFRPNDGTAWWVKEQGPGPYDDPEQRPAAERCLLGFGSTQGPPMLPVLYNNHKRIVQTKDHVMILVEMVHDARIVRINAKHEPPEVRKWLGDSIGWWEGDTLVIDTTNFRDEPGLMFASRDLHVVERFTRLDANTLHYAFEVTDPNTWTAPWKGDYVWPATDNRVFEYACHEGNYALGNIMRGARLLEAEATAKPSGSE
jgi:hypothetical protein